MSKLLVVIIAVLFAGGCAGPSGATTTGNKGGNAGNGTVRRMQQHKLSIRHEFPSVGLSEYFLVTDDLERDRAAADEVVRAKMGLPHAMHTKRREDFEAILGRNFTMKAPDEFFDREGYISNRVGDPAKVRRADYRNLVVQFVTPERALVTYSNVVEDEPGGPGAWKADMTWADILAKEDGKWKYDAVHLIEFKDLTQPNAK